MFKALTKCSLTRADDNKGIRVRRRNDLGQSSRLGTGHGDKKHAMFVLLDAILRYAAIEPHMWRGLIDDHTQLAQLRKSRSPGPRRAAMLW